MSNLKKQIIALESKVAQYQLLSKELQTQESTCSTKRLKILYKLNQDDGASHELADDNYTLKQANEKVASLKTTYKSDDSVSKKAKQ